MNEDETFDRLRRSSFEQLVAYVYTKHTFANYYTEREWYTQVLRTFTDPSISTSGWEEFLKIHNWESIDFLNECKKRYSNE